MNLMRLAIDGNDIDLLRLLADYADKGITPVLAPILDRARMRCVRKGWARCVVYGTEITQAGREQLKKHDTLAA